MRGQCMYTGGGGTPLSMVAYDMNGVYETWNDVPATLAFARRGNTNNTNYWKNFCGALNVPSQYKNITVTTNNSYFYLLVIDVEGNRYNYEDTSTKTYTFTSDIAYVSCNSTQSQNDGRAFSLAFS